MKPSQFYEDTLGMGGEPQASAAFSLGLDSRHSIVRVYCEALAGFRHKEGKIDAMATGGDDLLRC
jgi:hypothetical protein